jgi:hypothetical protein
MTAHRNRKQPGVVKCRFCPAKFPSYKELVEHVAVDHCKIKIEREKPA